MGLRVMKQEVVHFTGIRMSVPGRACVCDIFLS